MGTADEPSQPSPGRDAGGEPVADEDEIRIAELGDRFLDALRAGAAPDRRAVADAHPAIRERVFRRLTVIELLHGATGGSGIVERP